MTNESARSLRDTEDHEIDAQASTAGPLFRTRQVTAAGISDEACGDLGPVDGGSSNPRQRTLVPDSLQKVQKRHMKGPGTRNLVVLTPSQTRALYRRLAPHYDRLVGLFRLAGARVGTYRRGAVEALRVSPGDTVVDLGCGTGRNFPWLERAVTASGRIVGVDLTDAMLREAGQRVASAGWANVDLVESDAADYQFPANVGGVLSTFAMTMVDDYDGVIRRAAEALRPGGRLAILEMRRPEGRPEWMVRSGSWLLRPFGVRPGYSGRPGSQSGGTWTRSSTRNSTLAPFTSVSGGGVCDQARRWPSERQGVVRGSNGGSLRRGPPRAASGRCRLCRLSPQHDRRVGSAPFGNDPRGLDPHRLLADCYRRPGSGQGVQPTVRRRPTLRPTHGHRPR